MNRTKSLTIIFDCIDVLKCLEPYRYPGAQDHGGDRLQGKGLYTGPVLQGGNVELNV